jgi:starch synthase
MQEILLRLERAITYVSNTVLCNNLLFNSILETVERDVDAERLDEIVRKMPSSTNPLMPGGRNPAMAILFRQALFLATRNHKIDLFLRPVPDESVVEARERKALAVLRRLTQSKLEFVSQFGQDALTSNSLGPIYFVAPELGPFSKVGGLSTMVWELAKELEQLGLDIHVISPYYNVSPKGETDYLKRWGIKFLMTIQVYVPSELQIGIHYGVVEGIKCWFLHHYTFFAAPYQTGSCAFRLQLLVLMAKASLELCCQTRIIPALVISNDWMTGLVPAVGRKLFGSAFDGTKFLHIFHNLGVGYAGKLWPPDGDTGALRYIHQLPDEMIVDPFDHSFDPSRCALLSADQWATVSKRYRDDLLGSSPYKDFLRAGYRQPFAYSNGIRVAERLAALDKLHMTHEEAKRHTQQKYFGYVDDNKCLLVFIGRIVEQKGVLLIIDSFESLNQQYHGQLQFIVGGQAAPDDRSYGQPCTHRMWDLKQRYPHVFWADPSQFFGDGLLVCHAADYLLVPSLFEPSGIVQQEAFASGTPVVAFRTGGLADTVFEFNRDTRTGNGFLFWSHSHQDFNFAVQRAVTTFYEKDLYWQLRKNAFESTLSTQTVAVAWAREFARLFMKIFEAKDPARESATAK